jgi:hypothetical protein
VVNIFQHTEYCEGRGYVNSLSLNEGMAAEQTANRVQRDGQESLQRGLLYQQFGQALQDTFRQPAPPPPPINPVLRALVGTLQGVSAYGQQALQQVLQQALLQQQALLKGFMAVLRPPLDALQKLLATMASLFFNKKAERNEHDGERDALRDDNEAAFLDPFSFITLKEPNKSGLGPNA